MAIFTHSVKVDGKWFKAGEEVKTSKPALVTEPKAEDTKVNKAEPKKPAKRK